MGVVSIKGVQELIMFSVDKPCEVWNDQKEVWNVFNDFDFPKGGGEPEASVFVYCKSINKVKMI